MKTLHVIGRFRRPGRYDQPRLPTPPTTFHALLDEHWEWVLDSNPVMASMLGDKRGNDRWGDNSLEGHRGWSRGRKGISAPRIRDRS